MTPILPIRKLRFRDVKCLAHGCTADKGQVRACLGREEARTLGWLGWGGGERGGGQTLGKASPPIGQC